MKRSRLAVRTIACVFVAAALRHESLAAQNAPTGELALTVRDMTGLQGLRPVTGGVPLAAGAAPRGASFVLTNVHGETVPCQSHVLTQWKEGSARWVLLDFQAAPPPNGTARFTLRWSGQAEASAPKLPVNTVNEAKGILQTGSMRLGPADEGVLSVGDRLVVRLTLIDGHGRRCRGVVESSAVEARGPVRGTVLLRGAFRAPDESRVLGFRLRASVFAGLSRVFLEPHLLVDADSGVIHRLRGLSLDIVPRSSLKGVQLGGAAKEISGASVRLLQLDDESYRLEGVAGEGSKAPGWAELTDATGTVGVAVRDFWQQWPKSLESAADGLKIGLFPTFSAGTFAHMEPWYKHQYLFDGDCYQLRMGQSRRWQIWLDTQGDGDALARSTRETLADYTGIPLCEQPDLLQEMERRFQVPRDQLRSNLRRQTQIPTRGTYLKSSFGTAAGLVFEHDDFVIVALPGPPRELQPMVREGLIPYLTKRFVYAEDETTLEQCVAKLLEARGTTLALGEVGSAGAVAAGLDAVNGAERILMGAFVAPTEERMRQLLRVPDDAWPQNAPSDQRAKLLADVAAERTGGGWVVVVGQPQSGDSGTNFVEVAFRPPNGNADTQRFSLRGTGEMSRASLTTQILDQLRRRLR